MSPTAIKSAEFAHLRFAAQMNVCFEPRPVTLGTEKHPSPHKIHLVDRSKKEYRIKFQTIVQAVL